MNTAWMVYLTAFEAQLYQHQRGALRWCAQFNADTAGFAALATRCSNLRDLPLYVVVDLSSEDMHPLQIPRLGTTDRNAVLARRLEQRYGQSAFRVALPQSRPIRWRRWQATHETCMLAGLIQPETLTPWINALLPNAPLWAGVFTPSLSTVALAQRLSRQSAGPTGWSWDAPHLLLVTLHQAGIRQTFLTHGQLRLSRLEALPAPSGIDLVDNMHREIHRLLQYLLSMRMLPSTESAVPVVVIVPDHLRARCEAALQNNAQRIFHFIGLQQACLAIGLRACSPQSGAEQLFLHLTVTQPPSRQFASDAMRRRFFLAQWQQRLERVSALASVLCLAAAGLFALHTWHLQTQSTPYVGTAPIHSPATRPPLALPEQQQRTLSRQIAMALGKTTSAPLEEQLNLIAQALSSTPGIEPHAITWRRSPSWSFFRDTGQETTRVNNAVHEVLEIDARLTDFSAHTVRHSLKQVTLFQQQIERASSFRLRESTLPLDLRPAAQLAQPPADTSSNPTHVVWVFSRELP